jgi:hypothetical protein
MQLQQRADHRIHPDSYGYRPAKSAHEALAACRQRCWKNDSVIDLDVQKFFRRGAVGPRAPKVPAACSRAFSRPRSERRRLVL